MAKLMPKSKRTWPEIQAMAKLPPRVLQKHKSRIRASYAAGMVTTATAQWAISTGNANREIRYTLPMMRARSRMLSRDDPYAKKFLDLVETNIVGAFGISVQNRATEVNPGGKIVQDRLANQIIEREFAAFSRAGVFDVTGKLNRAAFERLMIRTIARDGEVLIKTVTDKTARHGIRFQLLESDWLDETMNTDLPNGNRVIMGVELNASGRPVAYHMRVRHPGDEKLSGTHERVRYTSDVVRHYFLSDRPEQVRGVPWMHAAMSRLYQLGEFDESAMLAARIGADKVMMLQDKDGMLADSLADGAMNSDGTSDIDGDGALKYRSQKGSIDILPPGAEIMNFDPKYPSDNYGPFVLAAIRGVASAFGVSYESLSNDRNGVTWTSIRHAVLDEREHWKKLQDWFIEAYAYDMYSSWMSAAIISPAKPFDFLPPGKINKFDAPNFSGRRWDWVNPKDDLAAKSEALKLRLTSHRRVLAEQGTDLEEILSEVAEDKILASEYGIDLDLGLFNDLINMTGEASSKRVQEEPA